MDIIGNKKIVIVTCSRCASRVLEFLSNTSTGKIEFTEKKYFGETEMAVFIFESSEAEVINTEIWVKGTFGSWDVMTFRVVE